ncbi:hypothetical protein Pcinc_039525 [Petrolisthes cinctipes]|uniref:Uncharacterized protein n=1 Tax=Petrolisthes cinctipes TaxID=88211 RepID=A0AAE1EJ04_PETCI|nr:hypothetical protein Pcinc_039525 [Petrolisthes cinctipes]
MMVVVVVVQKVASGEEIVTPGSHTKQQQQYNNYNSHPYSHYHHSRPHTTPPQQQQQQCNNYNSHRHASPGLTKQNSQGSNAGVRWRSGGRRRCQVRRECRVARQIQQRGTLDSDAIYREWLAHTSNLTSYVTIQLDNMTLSDLQPHLRTLHGPLDFLPNIRDLVRPHLAHPIMPADAHLLFNLLDLFSGMEWTRLKYLDKVLERFEVMESEFQSFSGRDYNPFVYMLPAFRRHLSSIRDKLRQFYRWVLEPSEHNLHLVAHYQLGVHSSIIRILNHLQISHLPFVEVDGRQYHLRAADQPDLLLYVQPWGRLWRPVLVNGTNTTHQHSSTSNNSLNIPHQQEPSTSNNITTATSTVTEKTKLTTDNVTDNDINTSFTGTSIPYTNDTSAGTIHTNTTTLPPPPAPPPPPTVLIFQSVDGNGGGKGYHLTCPALPCTPHLVLPSTPSLTVMPTLFFATQGNGAVSLVRVCCNGEVVMIHRSPKQVFFIARSPLPPNTTNTSSTSPSVSAIATTQYPGRSSHWVLQKVIRGVRGN